MSRRGITRFGQKNFADEHYLLRQWLRWRRERTEELLAGPYGAAARALVALVKTASPKAILRAVITGPWLTADRSVRAEIIALVDAAIIKRREAAGLRPLDDSPDDEKPNLFLRIRNHLVQGQDP
jgi:hypothetical protein